MDNNVMNFSPLATLANQIRAEIAADEATESWRTIRVELGIHLRQARAEFQNDDTSFGRWLVDNGLEMDPHKRRALIEMAEHPDLMRRIYAETDYTKDRKILEMEFRPQATTYGLQAIGPISVSKPVETPPAPATNVIPLQTAMTQTQKAEESKPLRSSSALSAHGRTGEWVADWIRPLAEDRYPSRPMVRAKILRSLAALKTDTLKKIRTFVEARPDLRPAIGSEVYGAVMFWEEVPIELAKDVAGHLSKPDAIVLKVLSEWDSHVAPVMRDWVAAGMPENAREWYRLRGRKPAPRTAPTISPELRAEAIAAGVNMDDERFACLPAHSIRQMIESRKPREYVSDHNGFRLPAAPAPIRVCGHDIWPCPPNESWTFRDAFYAYHLWLEIDSALTAREPRSKIRGRMMMNPMAPIMVNINGAVGHAFQEIVRAQFFDDDKEADTFGPPKTLLFQGE